LPPFPAPRPAKGFAPRIVGEEGHPDRVWQGQNAQRNPRPSREHRNDDTEYKRKLFETFERHSTGGVPVGELTLDDKPGPMRFRLVLEGDWKSQVVATLGNYPTTVKSDCLLILLLDQSEDDEITRSTS
jgi:hypothetical protein